jgi:hypothetical protein
MAVERPVGDAAQAVDEVYCFVVTMRLFPLYRWLTVLTSGELACEIHF